MRFILPKKGKEYTGDNYLKIEEYGRRTELITKMLLEGWLVESEVQEYINGIIESAEPFDDNGAIFWSVDSPDRMPRDARMAYAYEPTYNIVAFLINAYWKKPTMLDNFPGFKTALKGGMLASTYADFRGNHAEDDNYAKRIYKLFDEAGARQFCSPGFQEELCPEFTRLFFAYDEYFYNQDFAMDCGENK